MLKVRSVTSISSAHNKGGHEDINIVQILHLSNFFELKRFKHAFEEKDQKKVEPCGSCFARLVLLGE